MVVLVFHAPSLAYLVEDLRGWFAGATIEVDALPVRLLACFLLSGLSIDLCDGSDVGEVYLYCIDADITHAPDVYGSMAEFWICV